EQRSRQPSVFSALRALIDLFSSPEDEHLGFYGAFGYDLVYQFEPIKLKQLRAADQRDLVLYLPDAIHITDHMRQVSEMHRYEFAVDGMSSVGKGRANAEASYATGNAGAARVEICDHGPGEYAAMVRRAKEA